MADTIVANNSANTITITDLTRPDIPPLTSRGVSSPPAPGATEESWYKHNWRPTMAWLYALICLFDFIIAPVLMMSLSVITKTAYVAWVPLTLQGGGLVHLSFGAIIGLYTWGRTNEKLRLMDNGETPSAG